MLTSYLVRCPGCGWFGSLLPSQNQDSWREAVPTISVAVFSCPECQQEWRGKIQGDDVIPLPPDKQVATVQ